MALAEFARRWSRYFGASFAVAHVHHGLDVPATQRRFRRQAQALVRDWCAGHGIPCFTNVPEKTAARSEAELRAYREAWLEKWVAEGAFDALVFAHHADDLLETRLLRLIRGTGPEGLVGMRLWNGRKLRPLLSVSRGEIETYARARALEWREDPTNSQTHALRNWIRTEWLPRLEERQKGARRSLSRSLSLIARGHARDMSTANVGLRRDLIKSASFSEREILVAQYLRAQGFKDYAQSHVHEILKRIDTRRKNLTFEMLGVVFEVTPDFLRASRV